jgi:hypothetical protein
MDFEQKTKELYARNVELETQLINFERYLKVPLPKEVFEAFERLKRTWGQIATQDEMNQILMNAVFIAQFGDLLVLKQYALKHPTNYMKAIVNGYTLENTDQLTEEVTQMINQWIDTPYDGDEKKDIRLFAEKLTDYYKQKLLKTS